MVVEEVEEEGEGREREEEAIMMIPDWNYVELIPSPLSLPPLLLFSLLFHNLPIFLLLLLLFPLQEYPLHSDSPPTTHPSVGCDITLYYV